MFKPKEKLAITVLETLLVLAVIGILAAMLMAPKKVQAQSVIAGIPFVPNYLTTPTNITSSGVFTNVMSFTLTNGQGLALTSGATDYVRQNNGESILASVTTTNPFAVGTWIWFDVNADGTNYTTTHPFSLYVPTPGIGTFVAWTNESQLALNNVRVIRPTIASNSVAGTLGAAGNNTNTVTINWLEFSRSIIRQY